MIVTAIDEDNHVLVSSQDLSAAFEIVNAA
jgi:hypothetical protein